MIHKAKYGYHSDACIYSAFYYSALWVVFQDKMSIIVTVFC